LLQNKISAILITGNEEENIRDCLESIKWADEIIVVDSESTDKTVEIAKEYTDIVFIKKWEGFRKQKQFAFDQAANEWIFSLDADEVCTEKLRDRLLSLDTNDTSGYIIKRENYLLGKHITSCGWEKDYQLRFFKKSRARIAGSSGHEAFVVDEKVETINEPFLHYTYNSLYQAIEKSNRYSSLEARNRIDVGKDSGIVRLIIQPPISFYQYFVARKGFKDGVYGFLISLLHALTKLMVFSKVWELKNRNNFTSKLD
jgi:glycosyltransferase involved in cell wall biosynthesis